MLRPRGAMLEVKVLVLGLRIKHGLKYLSWSNMSSNLFSRKFQRVYRYISSFFKKYNKNI